MRGLVPTCASTLVDAEATARHPAVAAGISEATATGLHSSLGSPYERGNAVAGIDLGAEVSERRVHNGSVGIIANPVSARDIRRVVADASSLQVADRTNIVLRGLAALAAAGVEKVLAMPDKKGIQAMLQRAIERDHNLGRPLPAVEFLDIPVTSTVKDTHRAAHEMAERGVDALIVLGGDGTHRATVSACDSVPIAGLSTGTNNAYPELRESTITGLAVGLYAVGAVPESIALLDNKVLDVSINDGEATDLALVDVVASTDRFVGARALWRMDSIIEIFVTFANPEAIGMSAIAGAIEPVDRATDHGLHVALATNGVRRVMAAIGPGMVETVGIEDWSRMTPGRSTAVSPRAGTLALDGEREVELKRGDTATVTLRTGGFRSIDVGGVMRWAAETGEFFSRVAEAVGNEEEPREEIASG